MATRTSSSSTSAISNPVVDAMNGVIPGVPADEDDPINPNNELAITTGLQSGSKRGRSALVTARAGLGIFTRGGQSRVGATPRQVPAGLVLGAHLGKGNEAPKKVGRPGIDRDADVNFDPLSPEAITHLDRLLGVVRQHLPIPMLNILYAKRVTTLNVSTTYYI